MDHLLEWEEFDNSFINENLTLIQLKTLSELKKKSDKAFKIYIKYWNFGDGSVEGRFKLSDDYVLTTYTIKEENGKYSAYTIDGKFIGFFSSNKEDLKNCMDAYIEYYNSFKEVRKLSAEKDSKKKKLYDLDITEIKNDLFQVDNLKDLALLMKNYGFVDFPSKNGLNLNGLKFAAYKLCELFQKYRVAPSKYKIKTTLKKDLDSNNITIASASSDTITLYLNYFLKDIEDFNTSLNRFSNIFSDDVNSITLVIAHEFCHVLQNKYYARELMNKLKIPVNSSEYQYCVSNYARTNYIEMEAEAFSKYDAGDRSQAVMYSLRNLLPRIK